MRQAKRNLKVKRPSKVVSVAGIAGAFLASSTSGSVADTLPQSIAPFRVLNLGEEEISDVSLATFHFRRRRKPGNAAAKGTTRSRRLRRRLRRMWRTRRLRRL
jgi:hypothetical protein